MIFKFLRRPVLLVPLAVAALVVACAGTLPRPTENNVEKVATRWPGTTRADLERGRDLYMNRCSSCHALIPPGRYPESKWHDMLGEMAPRAKLGSEDRDVVYRYLVSFARQGS